MNVGKTFAESGEKNRRDTTRVLLCVFLFLSKIVQSIRSTENTQRESEQKGDLESQSTGSFIPYIDCTPRSSCRGLSYNQRLSFFLYFLLWSLLLLLPSDIYSLVKDASLPAAVQQRERPKESLPATAAAG